MRSKSLVFWIAGIFLIPFFLLPLHAEETGMLIVTYQTGPKAERLDRIRFLLKDQNNHVEMYPKGDAYVDDVSCMSRMVVIESLPPAIYTLQFIIPNTDKLFDEIPIRKVQITEGRVAKVDQVMKPRYASIKASAILMPESPHTIPTLTLRDFHGHIRAQSTVGKFSVRHLLPGHYQLIFEAVDGYGTPAAMSMQLGPNEILGPIEVVYNKSPKGSEELKTIKSPDQESFKDLYQKTVLVPDGKVIIGESFRGNEENELPPKVAKVSAFYIGVYEVTNSQYAQWLNRALNENNIVYHSEGQSKGYVTNPQGWLLFKTQEADPLSQILTHQDGKKIIFLPMLGKHNFPVIDVTWHGAQAYCQDNQFRLPTEAEWEKAAGMAIVHPGEPLKKYRYGFQRDAIDKSWANYKEEYQNDKAVEVMTTRVGFYNGINKAPIASEDEEEVSTQLAISPVGAYDMSGNVWEWVSDWYDDTYYANMPEDNPTGPKQGKKKVAKGGCYDSLANGVRVAERMGLPPDHADTYTGFRVAASK